MIRMTTCSPPSGARREATPVNSTSPSPGRDKLLSSISQGYLNLSRRTCAATTSDNQPCKQAPLLDADLCFWHSPTTTEAAQEARRLGGQRGRRESSLSGAYQFEGLDSIPHLRRLLDIAAFDALALDGSVPKVRAIISLVLAGAKLLESGEFEERLEAIEAVLGPRLPSKRPRR